MALSKKNTAEIIQLGEHIRKRREELKLSQDVLADRTDLSGNAISRYELGTTEPGAITLYKIAAALGITTDALAPDSVAGTGDIPIELQMINGAYKKLSKENQAVAYKSIMAMLNGFAG